MCEVRKAADDAWLDQYYQLEAYYLKHDPGYPYKRGRALRRRRS